MVCTLQPGRRQHRCSLERSEFSDALIALLPRLRRFAATLAGRGADADDLVQDAIERALRKRHQWQQGTRLDSWMFRIVQTVWIDTVRARKVRKVEALDDEGMSVVGIDGRSGMEAHFDLARVMSAVAAMAPELRGVVALVLVEGYAYREAAEILSVPEGTVTSRLFRARTILDQALAATDAPAAMGDRR